MILVLLSTFVSIAFIVMAIYWLLFRPVSATAERLQQLEDPRSGTMGQSIEANTMESLAQRLAEPLNRLVDAGWLSFALVTRGLSGNPAWTDAHPSHTSRVGVDGNGSAA